MPIEWWYPIIPVYFSEHVIGYFGCPNYIDFKITGRIQGSVISGLRKPLPSMHKPGHQAKDHAIKDSTGRSKETPARKKPR